MNSVITKKSWWVSLLVIVLAIGVLRTIFPFFGNKYIPTHDGEYHIIRIVEFSRMLEEGYLLPRWAPTLNSGHGIPIFNFHYPLPNYLGSFMRDFVTHDAVYAFQASVGVGYVLIILGVFLWLLSIFGVIPALVGAITVTSVPYLLVDLFIRGSIGEIWAFVFFFFILFCIEKQKNLLVAFCYGLLIISHNIMGMIFTPLLFLYTFVRNRQSLIWFLGGLGFSAFFWIPALFEQKYVVGLNTVNYKDHFAHLYELFILSWGSGFSGYDTVGNKMSLQIGIAPLSWIIISAFLYRNIKDRSIRILYLGMIGVFVISLFCMLRPSLLVWELIKPMQYIQYPWRFLLFLIPISAFVSAVVAGMVKRTWILFIVACVSLLLVIRYNPVLYEPRNEAYYLARQNFTDGTSSMGNSFSTIWTGWKDKRPEGPVSVQNGSIMSAPVQRFLDKQFVVSMSDKGDMMVNTLYFPGWIATIDNKEAPIYYQMDGIIHIIVPQGNHIVRVTFTDTTPRKLGNAISILSLATLATWGILRTRRKAQL